jgi:hypothetical protein
VKDSKAGEDFCCGVVLALFIQGACCLREGGHLEDEADGEECLEEEGRRPWMGAFAKERPKIEPVGNAETDNGYCSLQVEEYASVGGLAHLVLVHGYC